MDFNCIEADQRCASEFYREAGGELLQLTRTLNYSGLLNVCMYVVHGLIDEV